MGQVCSWPRHKKADMIQGALGRTYSRSPGLSRDTVALCGRSMCGLRREPHSGSNFRVRLHSSLFPFELAPLDSVTEGLWFQMLSV